MVESVTSDIGIDAEENTTKVVGHRIFYINCKNCLINFFNNFFQSKKNYYPILSIYKNSIQYPD